MSDRVSFAVLADINYVRRYNNEELSIVLEDCITWIRREPSNIHCRAAVKNVARVMAERFCEKEGCKDKLEVVYSNIMIEVVEKTLKSSNFYLQQGSRLFTEIASLIGVTINVTAQTGAYTYGYVKGVLLGLKNKK